jgi:hypothetical protein
MARSKDAIKKRAEKRDRSIAEQRKADAQDMEKQIAKKLKKDYNPYAPGERQVSAASSHSGPPRSNTSKSPRPSSQDPASEPRKVDEPKRQDSDGPLPNRQANKEALAEPGAKRQGNEEALTKPGENRQANDGPLPNRQANEEALTEPGAWACKNCGNHNFASRKYCNSKTCTERRPRELAPQSSSKPKPRHDAETSKKIEWGDNAPVEKINQNLELRKRYKETDGEGMSEDEVKRAKLLLERDERKKMRKEEIKATRKGTKKVVDTTKKEDISKSVDSTAEELKETDEKEDSPTETAKETDTTDKESDEAAKDPDEATKEPDESTLSKEELRARRKEQAKKLKKDNKRLRMIYAKTGGEGMDEKVVEKVKILLERDERKKRKRAEKEVPAERDERKKRKGAKKEVTAQ